MRAAFEVNHRGKKALDVLDSLLPKTTRCLNMFHKKIIYYYSILNLLIVTAISAALLFSGLKHFNADFWSKYGLLVFGTLDLEFLVAGCLSAYPKWQYMRKCFALQLPWDLSKLPPTCRNKIQKLCQEVEVMFVLLSLMMQIGNGIVLVEILVPLIEFFYTTIPLLDKLNTPVCKLIIAFCLCCSGQFMALMASIVVYYSYYFIVLLHIQFIMLDGIIKYFREHCSKYDNRVIRKKLIFLVKRHQGILRAYYITRQPAFIERLLISISLLLAVTFSILLLYSPHYGCIASIVNFAGLAIVAFYFSHQGQVFEDLHENIHQSLYDLNWYEWDVSNMKIFRTFHMGASADLQQQALRVANVNHEYFKQHTIVTVSPEAEIKPIIEPSGPIRTCSIQSTPITQYDKNIELKNRGRENNLSPITIMTELSTNSNKEGDGYSVWNKNIAAMPKTPVKLLHNNFDEALARLQQILANNFSLEDSLNNMDNSHLKFAVTEVEGMLTSIIDNVESSRCSSVLPGRVKS